MANTIDFNVNTNAVTVLNQIDTAAENTAQGFASAKAELRALQQQLLSMDQTSEAFKKASARAAELKDSIGDLSAEISANAGNAFEGVSNNVSLFGSRLMSLDLKGAGQALTAVGAASKRIGFKEMATELGGLTKGILSLGKALLTNPLFLLGSVIAMIVTNFDSLSKSGGVLGSILTKIGDLINWAIQGFQDLTDAIGLTSIAAQKEAEKVAQVAKDIRDEIDNIDKISADRKKKVLEEFNNDINKAYDAEKKRIDEILKDNERQMKGYEDLYNSGKVLNESQLAMYDYFKTESTKFKAYIKDFGKEVDDYNDKQRKEQQERNKKALEEIDKELEANAIKAAAELKIEQELAAKRLKVQQDYARSNMDEQEKELYELELKKEEELRTYEGAEEDKLLILEKYKLAELDINKKYDDAAFQQQIEADAKAKEEREKQNEANAIAAAKELDLLRQAEEQKAQLRVDAMKTSLSIISDLAGAFAGESEAQQRKAFQIQKGVSIATATIDTYLAAQGAYRSQMAISTPDAPVRAAVAAGIAIAQGLARVAIISKQQFNGGGSTSGGSGGGSVPSAGGMQPPSPANFAFVQNQPNQQPPLQAYVVSTQVSSNLEAQQLINNQARLGG